MEKIILKKRLTRVIEVAIHQQRLWACGADNPLIDKELRRHDSHPVALRLRQEPGDPGRNISNHGWEARGI
ncbi:MAG: hypothetical protein CML20_23005 [Rheinheimera sp.]|nr:hypothetical protein [Rheinheimera sp.]